MSFGIFHVQKFAKLRKKFFERKYFEIQLHATLGANPFSFHKLYSTFHKLSKPTIMYLEKLILQQNVKFN